MSDDVHDVLRFLSSRYRENTKTWIAKMRKAMAAFSHGIEEVPEGERYILSLTAEEAFPYSAKRSTYLAMNPPFGT